MVRVKIFSGTPEEVETNLENYFNSEWSNSYRKISMDQVLSTDGNSIAIVLIFIEES